MISSEALPSVERNYVLTYSLIKLFCIVYYIRNFVQNIKCEHSNVVINVAYSKLKLQLQHFRITFLLLSQLTFQKIDDRGEGLEKIGNFNKRSGRGTLIWYME